MRQRLASSILKNIQYKVAALILACLFWYIVQGEEILEVSRRVDVLIKVPEGYVVKGPDIRHLDATLRGSRVLIGDFPAKALEATINVPRGKTGQYRFRIDKDYFKSWDNRIKLTVHDPYITVFVDEKETKKVPVREFLKGVPADGYIIEKSVIKPSVVTVEGPRSEVDKLEEILTEPIDVDNLSANKSFEARLIAKDSAQSTLSLDVDRVTVNLSVGEKKINKRFGSVPVEVVGSDFLTAVKPRFVSIVIQGTPGVLSFVKRSDLEAFVEARELEPGKKHMRSIQVKIPPETVLIETFPQTATVEVYNQKRLN
jgi:YbbR domain-containing protein